MKEGSGKGYLFLFYVVLRRKTQSTSSVSVELWLHSDTHILIPSFWTERMLRGLVWGPSAILVKDRGFFNTVSGYGAQRGC